MAAGTITEAGGWTSRHPKLVGVLILLALHCVFALGPLGLPALTNSSHNQFFEDWSAIREWTGFKRNAVPPLIGIVQLYYVVPAVLLALKLQYPAVAKGIVHGTLVIFLLNAADCGLFLWGLSKIDG
jgi:hypothetical protein